MEWVGLFAGGIVGLVLAINVGLKWGESLRDRPSWRYWSANGVVMMAGIFAVFVGVAMDLGFLWTGGVGLMGGGITGLKYGYGRSIGLWRTVDRITGSDELPRE